MNIEYKFNRFFLIFCAIFILVIMYLTIRSDYLTGKPLRLFLSFIFLYAICVLYSLRIVLTDHSIKNSMYFSPFYHKERECEFSEIGKISYDFLILEEVGSFKIYPKIFNKEKIVVINFLVNNKKEIIEKLLEKRSDLKIEGWVRERILNYKLVHWKFSLILFIIILLSYVLFK